jgi:hypothetical protein
VKLNLYKAVQITCSHVAAGGKLLEESFKSLLLGYKQRGDLCSRLGLDLHQLDDRRVFELILGHDVQVLRFESRKDAGE